MLVKFEQIVWTKLYKSFSCMTKNRYFFKPLLTNQWRHFGRWVCSWNTHLMLNYSFKDYHLSVFKNETRVTRLKVALNLACPITVKVSDSSFKENENSSNGRNKQNWIFQVLELALIDTILVIITQIRKVTDI